MKLSRFWLYLLPLLAGCSITRPLKIQYETTPIPPAPDYAQADLWLAMPGQKDSADLTPEGVTPGAGDAAKADVFWVYPTLLYKLDQWNASLSDPALRKDIQTKSLKFQSTAFNAAGRIYAPCYRQMAMGGFFCSDTADTRRALDLAYSDIKTAFEYYLKHYNNGRPIILAGHSQGALHITRLTREFFAPGMPLQPLLVASYPIGFPFTTEKLGGVPLCTDANQAGCIAGWNTFREGYIPPSMETFYRNALNVNPVSWTTDTLPTDPSLHQGIVIQNFKLMRPGKVSTQIYKNILWCENPIPGSTLQNYHPGDINLFWMNIRQNTLQRLEAYENQQAVSQKSVVLPQQKQQ